VVKYEVALGVHPHGRLAIDKCFQISAYEMCSPTLSQRTRRPTEEFFDVVTCGK
jgi:hypothetical protein